MSQLITFLTAFAISSAWSYAIIKVIQGKNGRQYLDANPQHIKDFESSRRCDCGGDCS